MISVSFHGCLLGIRPFSDRLYVTDCEVTILEGLHTNGRQGCNEQEADLEINQTMILLTPRVTSTPWGDLESTLVWVKMEREHNLKQCFCRSPFLFNISKMSATLLPNEDNEKIKMKSYHLTVVLHKGILSNIWTKTNIWWVLKSKCYRVEVYMDVCASDDSVIWSHFSSVDTHHNSVPGLGITVCALNKPGVIIRSQPMS